MQPGGYGLTSAGGQAQSSEPAVARAGRVAFPARSGLVPPLAEGFIVRPETVPGLETALVPGAAVALVSGQEAAGGAPGWLGPCGKTQLAAYLAVSVTKLGDPSRARGSAGGAGYEGCR